MKIVKGILIFGALVCALEGLGAILLALNIARQPSAPGSMGHFSVLLFFICLSFVPGFMLFKGYITKNSQVLLVGIVEATVIGLGLLFVYAMIWFFSTLRC